MTIPDKQEVSSRDGSVANSSSEASKGVDVQRWEPPCSFFKLAVDKNSRASRSWNRNDGSGYKQLIF